MIYGTQPDWRTHLSVIARAYLANKKNGSDRHYSFAEGTLFLLLVHTCYIVCVYRERGIGWKRLIKEPEPWEMVAFCQSHLRLNLGMFATYRKFAMMGSLGWVSFTHIF